MGRFGVDEETVEQISAVWYSIRGVPLGSCCLSVVGSTRKQRDGKDDDVVSEERADTVEVQTGALLYKDEGVGQVAGSGRAEKQNATLARHFVIRR